MSEIEIAGIGIAPEVLQAIVIRAVEKLEGIVSVGMRDIASNLVSMLSSKTAPVANAVETNVENDELAIVVHVTVFYGYPFKQLAESIRTAVVKAIDAQVGVGIVRVDVCIDGIVFPKE